MSSLSKQKCVPCNQDTKPLKPDTAKILLRQLHSDWTISNDGRVIYRDFSFSNYYETIAFVNAVAWMSQQQDHHPSLQVEYKSCQIKYSTHVVNGLTVNDFICGAKIDLIKQPELSDPELESSDKPRQYATEAIKLSDIESTLEKTSNHLETGPTAYEEMPSSITPTLDDDDEHIFNQEGEIVLQPMEDEQPSEPSPMESQTVIMSAQDLKDLSLNQAAQNNAQSQINNEHTVGDATIPDGKTLKPGFLSSSNAQSPMDTQTLIMSQEDLRQLANSTQHNPEPKQEDVEEDVSDTTLPQGNIPPADFSSSLKSKPDEPKEAQTVIMSLSDMQSPSEYEDPQASADRENNPDLEQTVIMGPISTPEVSDEDKNKAEDTQEIDPGIEEDDTLVMHANTYKRVQE